MTNEYARLEALMNVDLPTCPSVMRQDFMETLWTLYIGLTLGFDRPRQRKPTYRWIVS
jgi:hypothetical protein